MIDREIDRCGERLHQLWWPEYYAAFSVPSQCLDKWSLSFNNSSHLYSTGSLKPTYCLQTNTFEFLVPGEMSWGAMIANWDIQPMSLCWRPYLYLYTTANQNSNQVISWPTTMYFITHDGVYGYIRAIGSFLSHAQKFTVFYAFWYMLYFMQIDVLKRFNLLQLF